MATKLKRAITISKCSSNSLTLSNHTSQPLFIRSSVVPIQRVMKLHNTPLLRANFGVITPLPLFARSGIDFISKQGFANVKNRCPLNERTVKLGKTVRELHERLPSLLISPLPQEILSPRISLHLFPSTHPHLPTVSGRIAYSAALWTAPVAWGRIPFIGNVKLCVLSERMIKEGSSQSSSKNEKLIVRWETSGNTKELSRYAPDTHRGKYEHHKLRTISGNASNKITSGSEQFSGLFIFEFDEEGRILNHTIEHAQEGKNWENFTRVIDITDWLIGKVTGDEHGLSLGCSDSRLTKPWCVSRYNELLQDRYSDHFTW